MSEQLSSLEGSRGRVLLVDDVPANLTVLTGILEPSGYELLVAHDGESAIRLAARARPDLVLLDILMPNLGGIETCRRLKAGETTREIPVIFITARSDPGGLLEGFSAGAVDYVVKPIQADEVRSRVGTHVRLSRLAADLRERNRELEARTAELTAEIERRKSAESALVEADGRLAGLNALEANRSNLGGLTGSSRYIRQIVEEVRRLNQFSNTNVLITGESGTGKELVARAIHFGSPRSNAPFVPVNCAAVPAELAESTLFGHVKGAFTGALADRKGCFELADGGTLFLDEIGDMPASLQMKLLRVLEDGCVAPVGGVQSRKVNVRVVAATNADLQARIQAGAFRSDLYFRLARYELRTPPLRERLEDVPLLARHFLERFSIEMGFKPPPITENALGRMKGYDYPGNVRELRNIIERALIESGGREIDAHHIHLLSATSRSAAPGPARSKPAPDAAAISELPLNLARAEDLLIQRALQETGGNIADAARLLGVHRTRIYRNLSRQEGAEDSVVEQG